MNQTVTDLAMELRFHLNAHSNTFSDQTRTFLETLADRMEQQEPPVIQETDGTTIQAILNLLKEETIEVEPGDRVYVSSPTYGKSRYHMLNNKQDCIQIEQTNIDEKWPSRITIYDDELPKVLKTLLVWHLETVKQQQANAAQIDDLGDIDAHPF